MPNIISIGESAAHIKHGGRWRTWIWGNEKRVLPSKPRRGCQLKVLFVKPEEGEGLEDVPMKISLSAETK